MARKVFTFGFDGAYLGGTAVVIANTEEEARAFLEEKADNIYLESPPEPLKTGIVYFYNGDY